MNCDTVREALSAAMDGEPAGVPTRLVERHLAGCPACTRWQRAAHDVTRRVRLDVLPATGRSPEQLVAAVHASDSQLPRARLDQQGWCRLLLAVLAAAQVAVAVPILLLGHDRAAPIHVAHEIGAFSVAVAAGFAAAALRPRRAAGMLPIVGVAAIVLCATAVIDLVAARTTALDEAPHLLVVGGWLVLYRLAVLDRRPDPHAVSELSAAPPSDVTSGFLELVDNAEDLQPQHRRGRVGDVRETA